MTLPTSVAAQAERANELIAQLNAPAVPQEPQDQNPAPPAPAPEQLEQTTTATTPTETPAPPAPEPTQPAAKVIDEAGWEHRYRTLQGVIEANQRNWAAEKQQLLDQIRQLQQPPAAAPAPAASKQLVTEKDVETYGPELLDLIGRKAQEIADTLVAQKMSELQPVLEQTRTQAGQVAAQVYQSAQDKFYGELTRAVPDWQTVDNDTRWHAWLSESDPLSGEQRQAYLNDAVQKLDHARAARLFDAFKQAAGLNQPAPAPAAPATPPQSPSPRPVGTATAPVHREPQVSVKRSEIAAHYKRSSIDPMYRTTEDYRAMEQRINTATAAGQILEG